MTAAKPQSMAAQNDAPDDLIAELARLMADDASANGSAAPQPSGTPAAPVRIPGADAPQAPRLDLSALNPEPRPAAPAAPIRIPGGDPVAPVPPAASKPAGNINLDFAMPRSPAGPATPIVSAPVTAVAQPVTPLKTPEALQPALDHDSLADLIAAELSNDMSPANDAQPLPEAKGPPRGEDNFGVPPVFGFGSPVSAAPQSQSAAAVTIVEPEPVVAPVVAPTPRAEPVAPIPAPVAAPAAASTDAMTDIERLVAPIVQPKPAPQPEPVVPTPEPTAAAPSPALRSLATPTLPATPPEAPKRRPVVDQSPVDEAILAAAAATGAHVEYVHSEADDDYVPAKGARRRGPVFGFSRAVVGPVVALVLLAVAGGGLYWLLGQSGGASGPAPLIVADTAPIKEVPEPTETETPQSIVFNEISGGNDGTGEQLVSRDQADEEAVTEAATTAQAATEPTTGNVIDTGDTASVGANTDGLVNRKVRTVTVRPDGTIVSGADSVAGASILPVDRPNVPEVPGADFSTPDLIASANAEAGPDIDPATATADPGAELTALAPTEPTVVPVQPGTTVPVVDATGTAIAGRTVVTPVQRPSNFAQTASTALSTAAAAPAATPTATPATTAAAPTGTAGAYVQLSSQRTEEAARESAQAIATRYGVLFGGASLEIQRVDLADRGIYYRVLVPATDRAGAANICTNVQAAGGDCFVL